MWSKEKSKAATVLGKWEKAGKGHSVCGATALLNIEQNDVTYNYYSHSEFLQLNKHLPKSLSTTDSVI